MQLKLFVRNQNTQCHIKGVLNKKYVGCYFWEMSVGVLNTSSHKNKIHKRQITSHLVSLFVLNPLKGIKEI